MHPRLPYYQALPLGLTCLLGSASIMACEQPAEIELNIHTIFDESEPDTTWLHKLANNLHIDTQKATLENELAFLSPCEADPQKLYEVERHLRSRNYLRDAKVQLVKDARHTAPRIQIDTWDTWSLMPIMDFGRKGGKNHFEVGLKDRNLLGLGVDAELAYFSDPQRSGYKLDTEFPLFMGHNSSARVRLIDSPDGYQRSVFFDKPLVSVDSDFGGSVGFNREDRVDTLFHNSQDELLFRHQIDYQTLNMGWKIGNWDDHHLRVLAGWTKDEHRFSEPQSDYLPDDRIFNYPWVGMEWLEDDFVTMRNLHLIEEKEDINLGWHLQANLGHNLASGPQQGAWLWNLSASKGLAWNANTLLLARLQAGGFAGGEQDHSSMTGRFGGELIHRINQRFAWYASAAWQFSDNPTLDNPVNLGGDTGLRGYPLQYQYGEQTLLFSTELRYYPRINLFKLFELGGAVFYDAGKSFGDTPRANEETGLLQSAGIGARLYSTHSSDRQVIHIDLVHPFSDQEDVSGLEFRVEVKHAF